MITSGSKGRAVFISVIVYLSLCFSFNSYSAVIIDHTCTDLFQIPDTWIDQVKTIKMHYAHTSHGEQLTVGLERIEDADPKYSVAIGYSMLPVQAGAFCIFDGQTSETYIEPHLYWDSEEGRQDTNRVLSANPAITASMWAWCTQQDWNAEADTQRYLDAMAILEAANPGVTFIYMTGNAQATGGDGYNRHLRNNQIRDYCLANDKVLFDFADIDSWYNGEQSTYRYAGFTVPVEHPHYHGDEAGHTTYESCVVKGSAVWWMMARLAGWNPGTTTTTGPTTTSTITNEQPCPIGVIYGEYSAQANHCRWLRDEVLSSTPSGQEIIKLYYEWSPAVVEALREDAAFKEEVKEMIDNFLQVIGNVQL